MKLLKISLITSVTLFFATNYAEAQTASGGTDEYTTEDYILMFGLIIGLIGFFKLISMPKKDGRTKSGYKNNESPLRIKKRFIGLVMMVLGGATLYFTSLLTYETPVEKPTEPEVEKPAEPEVEKPADPEVEKPADPEVEKPADPEVEKPADPEVEKPAEQLN